MGEEDKLIEGIAKAVPSIRGRGRRAGGALRLGIGDDAALLASRPGREWVLSCDQFSDGIHFRAEIYPPDSVGYKSLVRATSDLAAMGAESRYFLLAMALPRARAGPWLDGFLRGMGRAARELGIRLVGGDTTRGEQISISITVIGEVGTGLAITRSGAQPGDLICVSGRLGRAALGLAIMESRARSPRTLPQLLEPHLYPKIRVQLGAWLARHRMASAMMDISDGLSTDLVRLCAASRVGARLASDRIPVVKIPDTAARALQKRRLDPLHLALHGGEDYELLFTVPQEKLKRLQSAPGFAEVAVIGEIVRGRKITLETKGHLRELRPGGWNPFS